MAKANDRRVNESGGERDNGNVARAFALSGSDATCHSAFLLDCCVYVCVCVLGTWKLNRDEEEKRSTAVGAMAVGCICHGCQLARRSGILPDDNKRSLPRLIVLDGGKWRMLSI